MATLHYENWDGVTAPSIPAGWNIQGGSNIVTSVTGGLAPTPISSPNMLYMALGNAGTATWGTADGVSGNVIVTGTGQIYGFHSNITSFAIFARGSASTLNWNSSSFYGLEVNGSLGTLILGVWVSGSLTSLASVSLSATVLYDYWFELTLTLNGSTIEGALRRLSDGYWLTSSATFQPGAATAITVTDSTISGSGYAGWYADTGGSETVFGDDWSLSSLTAPAIPPSPPVVVAFPFQYYPAWAE